jgi:2,3-dihydroxybenzoate-AMP ligase
MSSAELTAWPEGLAQHYRAAGYWRGETLGDMLHASASRYPTRTALVGARRRVTYAELTERADQLAAGFRALGIERGSFVIVQLPNVPEFVEVCFGLFRLGAVPVFALPNHRFSELSAFVESTQAVAYVTASAEFGFDYPALGQRLRDASSSLKHVLVLGRDGEGLARASAPWAGAAPHASEVAFLQLSGGSSGIPKLIPRTHDDYLYSVRRSAEICGLSEHSVYLCALPVAHNFPWSSPGVLGTLSVGGTVVFAERPSADVTFGLIRAEGVSVTALVPPLVALWLEAAKTRKQRLEPLALLQVGGAKLNIELARRVRPELGCALQQVYGMAEGLVCYTRLDDDDELVLGTQGRPMCDDDELRVVDAQGAAVPEGESGELWTRGPYTIRGYFRAPDANRAAFSADGFYKTGDLVQRLASGHLIVVGRSNDLINRGGEKISADELESHLLAHPQVLDAVVVGVPDRLLGEQACAFVVPRRDGLSVPQLLQFLRGRDLASYKLPDRVRLVEELPQTAVGKISRRALRAALRETLALPSK